jgi:hypothetical protein
LFLNVYLSASLMYFIWAVVILEISLSFIFTFHYHNGTDWKSSILRAFFLHFP